MVASARPSAETETIGKSFIRILGGTKGRRMERLGVSAWKESRVTMGPSGNAAYSSGVSNFLSGSGRRTAPESKWPPSWADFSSTRIWRGSAAARANRMAQANPAGPAPTTSTSTFKWEEGECTSAG